MNSHPISIQTRLVLLVLATVLLPGLLAAYSCYLSALRDTGEVFDAQLAQFTQNLIILANHTDHDADHVNTEALPPKVHKFQPTLAFQIWNINKEYPDYPVVLLTSDNMATMSAAERPAEGFSTRDWQGKPWRFYRQRDTQRSLDVFVGQYADVREEIARDIAWHNVSPFLVGIPFLAFFSFLSIRFGLRPLTKLTDSLSRLSPVQLHPVTMHDAPKEVATVLIALNNLLSRVTNAMNNERRFTADASHELRTPLAALQAQIQTAQLSGNENERRECLIKALRAAERMNHLIAQLLILSRLDEQTAPIGFDRVDLTALTRENCALLGSRAFAKNIDLSFHSNPCPAISGSADMLGILLRNLLDNAIRYTPDGGHVEVALRYTDSKQVELEISDSGKGVAEEQLTQLGQRFNRITHNTAEGVGLGLSIVQRIGEIHGIEIKFSRAPALGGLSIVAQFPPAL